MSVEFLKASRFGATTRTMGRQHLLANPRLSPTVGLNAKLGHVRRPHSLIPRCAALIHWAEPVATRAFLTEARYNAMTRLASRRSSIHRLFIVTRTSPVLPLARFLVRVAM